MFKKVNNLATSAQNILENYFSLLSTNTVLSEIGTEADASSTDVSIAELNSILPVITDVTSGNEAAYQAYIEANAGNFDSPATEAAIATVVSESLLETLEEAELTTDEIEAIEAAINGASSALTTTAELQTLVDEALVTLSVEEAIFNNMSLYPNPASSQFAISGVEVQNVEVYNLLGSKVLEIRNSNTINIFSL